MNPLKHLYLYFQDGQRLALRFPKQSEDPAAVTLQPLDYRQSI